MSENNHLLNKTIQPEDFEIDSEEEFSNSFIDIENNMAELNAEEFSSKIAELMRQHQINESKKAINESKGAIDKSFPCMRCKADTRSTYFIKCSACNKSVHCGCASARLFDVNGKYICEDCEGPKASANGIQYNFLKSDLAYCFASGQFGFKKYPISLITKPAYELVEWPADDVKELFSLTYFDEAKTSHSCIKCKQLITNKACFCKGCFNLYHKECCFVNNNETTCEICLPKRGPEPLRQSFVNTDRLMKRQKAAVEGNKSSTNNSRKSNIFEFDELMALNEHIDSSEFNEKDKIDLKLKQIRVNQYYQTMNQHLPPLKSLKQWDTFYKSFNETKVHFSDCQNIERLRKAIDCETIIQWGRDRLFDVNHYEERLQHINDTFNIPKLIMRLEFKRLVSFSKADMSNHNKLAKFLNEVIDFIGYVDEKDSTLTSQLNLAEEIIEILPKDFRQEYNEKYDIVEVDLRSLKNFLNKKLQGLVRSNADLLDFDANKNKKDKDKSEERSKSRPAIFQYHKGYKSGCCICNDPNHNLLGCKQAWKISGKEVQNRIKERHMCLHCGCEPYTGKDHKCQRPPKKSCQRPGHEDKYHYDVLCYLREASKNYSNNAHASNRSKRGGRPTNNRESNSKNNTKGFMPHNNAQTSSSQNIATNENRTEGQNSIDTHTKIVNNNSNGFNVFQGSWYATQPLFSEEWETSKTLTPVITLLLGPNKVPCTFLLDSGSELSMIEKYVVDAVGGSAKRCPLELTWSGDTNIFNRRDPNSKIVRMPVEALNERHEKRVMNFHTFEGLRLGSKTLNVKEVKNRFPYLKKLHLRDYKGIHGVIGVDQIHMFLVDEIVKPSISSENCYLGYRTPMGDYVMGSRQSLSALYDSIDDDSQFNSFSFNNNFMSFNTLEEEAKIVDENESQLLEKYLMGEEYYEIPDVFDREKADDLYAINLIENEMYKNENGHFVAPLIFKDVDPKLPAFESYLLALKRWYTLSNTLLKHKKFEEINNEIKKLIDKNYCELVPENEQKSYEMTYYIPIFCISPENKRTRVIWDAKAIAKDGKSLNSFLLPGPNLYNKILKLFFNMRSAKILIVGDLEEMFHQIIIKPEHRNALRFLWSDEAGSKPKIYRMTRLVFGINCAPCIAQQAVKLTAKEFEKSHPNVAKILANDIYMDDIVTSINSINGAKEVVVQLKMILKNAGFNLVKLKSSHPEIFETLRDYLTNDELNNEKLFPTGDEHRVLGYICNFANDTLKLGFNLQRFEKYYNKDYWPTKREVLSLCMAIFDPLGLFIFLTSKFKYIYHLVCNKITLWDDKIPEELLNLWFKALSWIPDCCNITVARCYFSIDDSNVINQIWAFSDASDNAECVIVYLRQINGERTMLNSQLITSKNYIVSQKVKRTIPELELDAATRAFELLEETIVSHEKIIFQEYYVVTDSSVVFNWLTYGVEKPSVYVKNRLNKILSINRDITVKWVPTDLQPADLGTKFSSMPSLTASNEWFIPKLFRCPENDWISDQFLKKDDYKVLMFNQAKVNNSIQFEKFSSLNKIVHILRKVFIRFFLKIRKQRIINMRKANEKRWKIEFKISKMQWRRNNELYDRLETEIERDIEDVNYKRKDIIRFLIKIVQEETMSDVINAVSNNINIPPKHELGKLNLCLKDDLLCHSNRIPEEILKLERFKNFDKYMIVLPSYHDLTKLIILQYHIQNNHFHIESTIAQIRKRYYIPRMRNVVKKTIKLNCYFCRLNNKRPRAPLMGDLPLEKLCVEHATFTNIMIDMCGPFEIKTKITRNSSLVKRYLLVVVCLTSRAIHIEIMNDASSDMCLKALLCTFEIRGFPSRIFCDRGTNFLGVDNAVQKFIAQYNEKLVKLGKIPHPISFKFYLGPARAPHMQGQVERMIKNVKCVITNIKKSITEFSGDLDDPSFRLLVISAMGLVNNRPLCSVSIDGVNTYLSPNSFIMGRENNTSNVEINPPVDYSDYWIRCLKLRQKLWQHYVDYCVPSWIQRNKWLKSTKNFEVGEIVLTLDYTNVNSWRLARVISVEKGSNDQTRKLTLLLGKRHSNASSKFDNKKFKDYYLEYYNKGKQYKVVRASAHVIKLNIFCKDQLEIENFSSIEEIEEELN